MTRYMLDTNIISDLIKNPQGRAAKRIAKAGEGNICTSIIVAAELRYGCAKNGSKRLLKAVEDLLGEIDVLQRPADRRPCPCNGHHNRDRQYRRVQTCTRAERRQLACLRRPQSNARRDRLA